MSIWLMVTFGIGAAAALVLFQTVARVKENAESALTEYESLLSESRTVLLEEAAEQLTAAPGPGDGGDDGVILPDGPMEMVEVAE